MKAKRAICCFVALFVFCVAAVSSENEPNICYTTHAGHCYTQVEWEAGWFWAHHSVSVATCVKYHGTFTMGDFWGMCNHIDLPDDTNSAQPNGASGSSGGSGDGVSLHPDYVVTLNTSYGSGKCELPPDGVEDDYSYDTSSCMTDF